VSTPTAAASARTTVGQALTQARASGVERLDAQLLLGHLLGRSRSWLLAHDDAALSPEQAARFHVDVARRAAGEPVAYLLGSREFHGLTLQVDARVLVPRPDTETLVDWAIEIAEAQLRSEAAPRAIDLGTGSGAIALALKKACPYLHVSATDASPDALDVARANAERLGLDVALRHGSWWEAADGAVFDLAVSNPPYVAADDGHLAALRFEPRAALTPGGDGSSALRAIVDGAARRLRPGAWLLLEHGFEQAALVRGLLAAGGFEGPTSRRDLAGHERCTGARRST
jgi:release factor glutamine methyltransferase